MEHFFLGLIVGIVLGVWLSVAVLYLLQSRGKTERSTADKQASVSDSVKPIPPSTIGSRPKAAAKISEFNLSLKTYQEQQAFQHLVIMTKGDQAQAERLVAYEHSKMHNASTEELITSAIDRWVRDNR